MFATLLVLLSGCAVEPEPVRFGGDTMGTTYHVIYFPAGGPLQKKTVDDLLEGITRSLSTYLPTSTISTLNTSVDTAAWHPVDEHFAIVFRRSKEVVQDTGGAFNPAVGPLVNAWGFGPEGPRDLPTESEIGNLLAVTRFEHFELRPSPPALRKRAPGARLDFNAIAEGYAVDAVGELLEGQGIKDYLVEIGGELRARGNYGKERPWQVGIERPAPDAVAKAPLQVVVRLDNAGMATSGNYRNYRLEGGQRFSHILNPATGRPERSSLLSVSVIAKDTMTADAYATALMVIGLDEGLRFVEARPGLEAFFIASDGAGGFVEKRSKGFPVGF